VITSVWVDDEQIHRTPSYALSSISGMGKPAPRQDKTDRVRGHGVVDSTTYYDARVLQLQGRCAGATTEALPDLLDTLEALFALDGADHVLRFTRQGRAFDEFVRFRVASDFQYDLAGAVRVVKWSVSLLAADPRIYRADVTEGVYVPTAAGDTGGVSFPLSFPLEFSGSSGAAAGMELTNGGNFPTPPVWTITGPVVNPTIVSDLPGAPAIATVGCALNAGDTLVIDVASRSVLLGGVTERPDLIDASQTSWFELPGKSASNPTGVTTVRLGGSGMDPAATSLAVSYHDARIN
jgi:hypothetical protein